MRALVILPLMLVCLPNTKFPTRFNPCIQGVQRIYCPSKLPGVPLNVRGLIFSPTYHIWISVKPQYDALHYIQWTKITMLVIWTGFHHDSLKAKVHVQSTYPWATLSMNKLKKFAFTTFKEKKWLGDQLCSHADLGGFTSISFQTTSKKM